MKRFKILRMKAKMLGCRVYTDTFGFDLPITKGVLEETGLYGVNNIFIIIKPQKPKEAKK